MFERERISDEMDCMRWYVPDDAIGRGSADEVLYEEMFHCTDLGTQIKEVIERFNASNCSITSKKTIDADVISYFNRPDSRPSEDFETFVLAESVSIMSSGI